MVTTSQGCTERLVFVTFNAETHGHSCSRCVPAERAQSSHRVKGNGTCWPWNGADAFTVGKENALKRWIRWPVAKVGWRWCTECLRMQWRLESDTDQKNDMPGVTDIPSTPVCLTLTRFGEKPLSEPPWPSELHQKQILSRNIKSLAKHLERFQTTHIKLLMSRHSFPTTLPNASTYAGDVLRTLAQNPRPLTLFVMLNTTLTKLLHFRILCFR